MENNVQKIHNNIPQLRFAIAWCRRNVLLWGRRTGKTEGPVAEFSLRNILDMPRSNGFAVGTTYTQLVTRTIPPLIAAWEKKGYKRDVHFWVRKYAPDKLRLPKAYRHPISPEHYIHWYNGTGIYLVSQDRPGTINGVATQWGFGDEAKFLNKEKLDEEVLLTLSGNYDKWGDKFNYLSTLFCSDMPTHPSGRWLLNAKEQCNPEIIDLIIGITYEISKEEYKYKRELSQSSYEKISANIGRLKQHINELKKITTYFSMASTIDNIHAIGFDAIKNFFRELEPATFLTSVLNEFVAMIENCFYSSLNPYLHGYDSENYSFVDSVVSDFKSIPERDCRWDGDIHANLPLDISCDYNNAINCVVTGQNLEFMHERRFLSSLYVEHPRLLEDLVDKWCDYYAYHGNKDVNYIYDQTASGGNAGTDISYADMWIAGLRKRKWNVNPIYTGDVPRHKARNYLWNRVLRERDQTLPTFRYNRENCKAWQVSCERAGVIQGANDKRDIKKDKRSERNNNIPAHEATHLSEAGDGLMWYYYAAMVENTAPYMEMMSV